MTGRLREICRNLPATGVLADIGCDHGYCTQYALAHGLCEKAICSDVSAGSLEKAKKLLAREIAEGRCVPVLGDGLENVDGCDCVLIAGLGGEEIVRILSAGAIPQSFVLQPMRNSEKLRAFLIAKGARIVRDYTFADGGYFYDLITGTADGGDEYSDFELLFGRENLKTLPEAFVERTRIERGKVIARLKENMQQKSRNELLERLGTLEVILNAVDEDL